MVTALLLLHIKQAPVSVRKNVLFGNHLTYIVMIVIIMIMIIIIIMMIITIIIMIIVIIFCSMLWFYLLFQE